MHIIYTPEHGFTWTTVATQYKAIKPLYDLWGEAGMFYLCNYSIPFSPYGSIVDTEERDNAIITELKNKRIGNVSTSGSIKYPAKLHSSDLYTEAEDVLINELYIIPDWKLEQVLRTEQNRYRKALQSIPLDHTDSKKLKEASDSAKNMQTLIRDTDKALAEVRTNLQKQINKSGLISPDEILMHV